MPQNVSVLQYSQMTENIWHDQGKWVACQRFPILRFLHHFLATLKMLHFDANPIRIRCLVTELWASYQYWKQYETKEFDLFLGQYLKTISATSDSFPLIMSHISMVECCEIFKESWYCVGCPENEKQEFIHTQYGAYDKTLSACKQLTDRL